ncbi:hypothetical protein KBY55_09595 [Streptomyces sp. b94]|uniref:hypothetical protein n=1 Tax=Streptomyces sp. b94 TaxID=1827634 RepID=UPI001B395748|nr:hypothetical protein [Streptomyces sp. b94]MBQ1096337.1 hypothetical protein [Streptomyces sp. b94]
MAVRMRHDGIEQEIEVPEISVKHYKRSGWKVVGDNGLPLAEKTTTAKRRRTEGDEG